MREGRERVDMAVVPLTVSVESTGPDSVFHTAEGTSVSPLMFSLTVQVRVRAELPASSGGPVSDTTVSTLSGSYGTGEIRVIEHYHT